MNTKWLQCLVCALLLTTVIVIESTGGEPANAQEHNVSTMSTSEQVTGASGSNRFIVWHDDTPGNFDILFKRSTDNGATWQATKNLSTNAGRSFYPQITVQGSNLYVVWCQENADLSAVDIFLRRSLDNGATWSPKLKISKSGTNDCGIEGFALPQVAASGSNVYVTWYDFGPSDAYFRRSLDNGASFGSIVNLSNSGTAWGKGSSIVALAAAGANVYAAWNEAGHIVLKHSTNNGASWSSKIDIGPGVGGGGPELIAVGSNAYLSWNNDFMSPDYEVYFSRSTNNGATWSTQFNVSNDDGQSGTPDMAISGSNVYLVWDDYTAGNSEIFTKRSTDGGATWKSVKNLSNNAATSHTPSVAVSGSSVYFTWADYTDELERDILLRLSTNNGGTMQPVVKISNTSADSFNPQVMAIGSSVYIVWTDETPGNPDILYRLSADNGAAWKAIKNLSNNSGESVYPQLDG